MVTLEKCRELLERQDGVEQVEAVRDEFVHAQFANRLNPKEPHDLVVHPVTEKQVLRVFVPHLAKAKSGGELFRVLSRLNYDMLLGNVGVDQDGEVRFEVAQACADGAVEDPSQEVFARLVETAMDMAHHVVVLTTYWGMVDAGVPEAVAKQFVDQFRQTNSEDDGEDTL